MKTMFHFSFENKKSTQIPTPTFPIALSFTVLNDTYLLFCKRRLKGFHFRVGGCHWLKGGTRIWTTKWISFLFSPFWVRSACFERTNDIYLNGNCIFSNKLFVDWMRRIEKLSHRSSQQIGHSPTRESITQK